MPIFLLKRSVILSAVFLAGSAFFQSPAAAGETHMVQLSNEGNGTYRVEAEFQLDASVRDVAWKVLTDYDNLDRFISTLKQSELKEQHGNRYLLDQQTQVSFLLIRQNMSVRLAIEEEGKSKLTFRDISGEDFEFYEGYWQVDLQDNLVIIRYKVRAKPVFSVPPVLAGYLFRKNADVLIESVRSEILRRHSGLI